MSIAAVRVLPPSPELVPGPGGRFTEVWRLTGDAAATTVTITLQTIDYVETVQCDGASHDITDTSQKVVILTFATAPGAVNFDAEFKGRKN